MSSLMQTLSLNTLQAPLEVKVGASIGGMDFSEYESATKATSLLHGNHAVLAAGTYCQSNKPAFKVDL